MPSYSQGNTVASHSFHDRGGNWVWQEPLESMKSSMNEAMAGINRQFFARLGIRAAIIALDDAFNRHSIDLG